MYVKLYNGPDDGLVIKFGYHAATEKACFIAKCIPYALFQIYIWLFPAYNRCIPTHVLNASIYVSIWSTQCLWQNHVMLTAFSGLFKVIALNLYVYALY